MFDTKKVSYAFCDKQGHQSQPLSRVCVDGECPSKTLICSICQELTHKTHKTIPLKVLLNKVTTQCSFEKNGINPLFYTKIIDQVRGNFFRSMNECRRQVLELLDDMQVKGKIYFNRIQQTTMSMIQIEQPIKYMGGAPTSNNKKIKDYFSKILTLINLDDKQPFSLENKLENIVDDCRKKNKKIQENLQTLTKQFDKYSAKTAQILDAVISFQTNAVFIWSNQNKGAKVKIMGTIAEQTGMESSGQRFAMLEPSLNQISNKNKILWGIKIKKFSGWIGVGMCLKQVIKKANYHFNYTNIGHGSYLISSNGYSWSHSVKQFNSASKTFQFTNNDTVYMEYDPKENKLWFMKNTGPQKFHLVCVPPPLGDTYNPCVNLCSTGDSVEIINPGLPIS